MKTFHNRVAVITGAASGFGREFALADLFGKAHKPIGNGY